LESEDWPRRRVLNDEALWRKPRAQPTPDVMKGETGRWTLGARLGAIAGHVPSLDAVGGQHVMAKCD